MSLLSRLRTIGLVIAIGTLGIGFVFLSLPGIMPALPLQYVFVSLLGLIAIIQGGWIVRHRWRSEISQDVVPDVEQPISTATPGEDLDQLLFELTRRRRGTIEYREQIRDRLVEAAIDAIRLRDDCSREAAIGRLEEGTWTDDTEAVAFFTGETLPAISLRDRIENWLEGRTAYERRVRRTVAAIGEVANLPRIELERTADEWWVRRLLGGALRSLGFRRQVTVGEAQEVSWNGEEPQYDYGEAIERRTTGRWLGVSAFSFMTFGFGLISYEPSLLVASAVGLLYAGYARSASPPDVDVLEVQRTLSNRTPEPGEEVTVTVRVHNEGDHLIPDLRLIDAVPGPMTVVDGSPRIGGALRPGKTIAFEYTMVAGRGEHEWPVYVIARDASGEAEIKTTIDVDTDIECYPRLETIMSMPVRALTSLFAGEVSTSIGGSGLEFHSVRDYRPEDPLNRIDWNRRARTGEFATINFREERSVNAVLMFDARRSAYLSPTPSDRHAVDRSVEAASEIFASLFDRGDQVGIAAFDTIPCWLRPGTDNEHRERARLLLGTHPAISSIPPTSGKGSGGYVDPLTHIQRQLTTHSQVILFSPLCDDYPAEVARRLDASGHLVTVVAPDPTVTGTIGQQLVRVERWTRLSDLRERGIRVIDWPLERSLSLVLQNASQRW